MKKALIVGAIAAGMAVPVSAYAQTPPCQYVLGFETLHNLAPDNIGNCLDNQAFANNGDALQHTAKGLMVWRKADNWTAFTNGYQTWINGPAGLVVRLNTQRYPWESDYGAQGTTRILPSLAPIGKPLTIAFDHNLVLPSVVADDGTGHTTELKPKGYWLNIYFDVRNNTTKPIALNNQSVTLGDQQGGKFQSMFDLRQVDDKGQEIPFSGSVQPGQTIMLRVTLDVANGASGGVLHVQGGNDVAAL
jgi:hypothetical protein